MALAASLSSGTAWAEGAVRTTLPLKSVRLYEAGVAYFERSGDLKGDSGVVLPIPAAHLDDALKTLVVLGAGSKVSGVEFRSTVSPDMARALAGLPAGGDAIDYAQLIRSIKRRSGRDSSRARNAARSRARRHPA